MDRVKGLGPVDLDWLPDPVVPLTDPLPPLYGFYWWMYHNRHRVSRAENETETTEKGKGING